MGRQIAVGGHVARVIESMGLTERLRAQLHETISSPSPTSNRVVDETGHFLGYLIDDDGQVRLVNAKARLYGRSPTRLAPTELTLSATVRSRSAREDARFLLSLGEGGGPVVISTRAVGRGKVFS